MLFYDWFAFFLILFLFAFLDRVIPTQGFGTHAHREFEIFSYSEFSRSCLPLPTFRAIADDEPNDHRVPPNPVLDGQLTHRDSLSNTEILKRGDLQMTSTGTGIRHSEFNDNKTQGVHFLQIWAMPNQRGLKPNYYTRHFSDEEKRGKLVHVVGPLGAEGVEDEREAKGAAPVHSWLGMWASLLPTHQEVTHRISSAFNPALSTGTHVKKVYIHLVQSSGYNTKASYTHADAAKVEVTDGAGGVVVLGEGDGVFVDGGKEGDVVNVKSVGGREAEFVLFEMD